MATNVRKNTAKLMMKKLQARLDSLYNEQESMKPKADPAQVMAKGGMIKKYFGGGFHNLMQATEQSQLQDAGVNMTSPFSQGMSQSMASSLPIGGDTPTQGGGFDWQNAGLSALGMAPNIYNLIQGMRKPEQLNARDYANPQYNQAIGLMSNRRYDVNPALDAIRTSERVGRRNLRDAGSAGQYLSNLGGLSASRMRAEGDIYSQKQNFDNQYMAEEAQMRAGLGSEAAQNVWRTDEANAMNRAARRNHLGAAATGVSNYAQMQQLNRNRSENELLALSTLASTDYFKERFPYWNDLLQRKNIKRK